MMDVGKYLASMSQKVGNAYYDESSRAMNADDLLFNNRWKDSFQSLSFGSTQTFNIANANFIGDCFLAIRFPGVASIGGNHMASVPLMAYQIIDFIEIQIAGSEVYRQDGIAMLQDILGNCDSKSKRDELIKYGGGDGIAQFTTARTFYAYLNLPFGTIAKATRKLPFDTGLITQPIQIKVYLKPGSAVYYQTGGSGLVIPSALVEGELIARQAVLKNPADRLKLNFQRVLEDGTQIQQHTFYNYPFMYSQSNVSGSFPGTLVGSPLQNVNLSGFRAGNLVGIRFMLYNSTNSPVVYPSTSNTNIIKTEDLLNFELSFNGLVIFRSKYDSWKMSNLLEDTSDIGSSTTPSGTRFYSLLVNVVDFIEKISGADHQSGLDLSGQTLLASFNTPTTDTYTLYTTYLYHAHLQADGVNAKFILN